jgi:hypothetical protein
MGTWERPLHGGDLGELVCVYILRSRWPRPFCNAEIIDPGNGGNLQRFNQVVCQSQPESLLLNFSDIDICLR